MSGGLSTGRGIAGEILDHYASGYEAERLRLGPGPLEQARTEELLLRYLPPAPAVVLDVGGGAGVYGCFLARRGYEVHLVDPVPVHVELARAASARQSDHPLAGVALGDARKLERADASVDVVLLFGPLYHLTHRADRMEALREARRVLRPRGLLLAVGISRFASVLDGMFRRLLDDPVFAAIVAQDLRTGQHSNPTERTDYFTTAYFHHPAELGAELEAAGLRHLLTLAIDGPGWLLQDFEPQWADPARRQRLLQAVRAIESEHALLGASAHLMAIGRRPAELELGGHPPDPGDAE
jgi:ubiquinone/menaquinone biosynthesis C-methylase UbiE